MEHAWVIVYLDISCETLINPGRKVSALMGLVIVGDEFYGRRAADRLDLPYRSMPSIGETDAYIAVVTTTSDWERIRDALSGETEAAVIACCQDCKPLLQLAERVGLLFAGIPRKDQLLAAIGDPQVRDEHMVAERSKIGTARDIENLVTARNGGGLT